MRCEINNDRCIRLGRKTQEPYLTHGRVAYFGSGREALISLAKALHLGPGSSVLLPAFMPEGIFKPFDVCGCRVVRYSVDEDLDPVWDVLEDLLAQERPVLAVFIHYFGLEKDATRFSNLCRCYGTAMLEDMAHILPGPNCSAGREGDYILYSPPKVVGVPDGGILVCRSDVVTLRDAGSRLSARRIKYVCQQISLLIISTLAHRIPAGRWLARVRRLTAPRLDSYSTLTSYFQTPYRTSWLSRWLLRRCEWTNWAAQRRAYADMYAAGLDSRVFRKLQGTFPVGGGPFAFPVLVRDREDLQRFLGGHNVSGLFLASRWDFIPIEERIQHRSAVLVLDQHFLFPTSQYLSEADVTTVIALANRWASQRVSGSTAKSRAALSSC